MVTLYGINLCYYFYIFSCHFLKNDLDHRRSDHSHLKIISTTTNVILATEEVTTATLKGISATTKVILTTKEVITTTLKVISATTKLFWPLKK